MPTADLRQPPLVGREPEWKHLREAIDAVRAGGFRVLFIEGEAGIGKTRLIEELISEASGSGSVVFHGSAEELEQARPFGAIADAVRRLGDARWAATDTLRVLLRTDAPPAKEPVLIDAFVDLIEEMSIGQPTCLMFEDLHWADAATLSAMRAVGRRLTYLPIFMVGTYRPHPRAQVLSRFLDTATRSGAVEMSLRPLDQVDVAALLETILGARAGERLRTLVGSAGGNPLYVTEIARALSQEGDLMIKQGVADVATIQLPPTLRLTILRRISFLPAGTLNMLRQAAVLGASFPLDELVAVRGGSVDEVLKALEPAIEAKIMDARRNVLAFRHDLIHEAIYQDVPVPVRASMHRDVARTLRKSGVAFVRVAEHVLRALDLGVPELFEEAFSIANEVRFAAPSLAERLLEKAGGLPGIPDERRDLALQQRIYPLVTIGRVDEASEIVERALPTIQDPTIRAFARWPVLEGKGRAGRAAEYVELLKAMAEDPHVADWHRHVLKMLLVVNYCRIDDGARARPLALELIEWARAQEREGRRTGFAEHGVGRGVLAGCAVGLVLVRLHEGAISEALTLGHEAVAIDEEARTPIPVIFTLLVMALMEADRFSEAGEALGRGRLRETEIGDATAASPYGSYESFISFLAGNWDEAAAEARASLDLIEEGAGSTDLMFGAHLALNQISVRRGDLNEGTRMVADMDRFIEDRGPQWGTYALGWTKALTLIAEEAPTEAYRVLSASWDASSSVRYFASRHGFADLVRLALVHGDRSHAESVTTEVEEGHRRAPDVPSTLGVALHCRGLVDDDADKLLAAVDAYRSSPRVVERSRACEDAAEAFVRREKREDARALYEEALAFYERVGAVYDIRRVTAAMRNAGLRRGSRAKRDRPRSGWEALTEAEKQVARLTVEGLTNPQIADRLFVSKHTVQTHLSHVFAKLGISSRAALAGIAAEKLGGAEES